MLSIEGLTKTYSNGVKALRGVSLEVDNGLFGLLGPNGAGKSTLMRTVATLQEPDSGRVLLDGRDAHLEPAAHRRRLGYLPQEFGVYPGVSAVALLDHLALLKGITNRRARAEQVDALLRRTNLYEHRRKAVDGFSGGMRRRFGIAQALLGDPRLIVVDEPTAGLDPEERQRFHELLAEIGERVIVVLSTHIVEDVRRLCPRMAILADGRILLEGEPSTLVEALAGRVWRKTVARDEVAAYRAEIPVLSTRLVAGRTQVQVLADVRPGEGFEPVEPDLEDVYFSALPRKAA
ncbi:MAG TPA: ABC transporter ATP-binding protein [Thermoanaerobaculia bacterium]|jgi:ABC-type multidrug transport system ATPase subunit|nr:ABC transporter ATP-binding protein [Thermoanaerobaculia bacterium]